jgi:3-oxoacyl-[acyl-carrier protein] reductase
VNTDLTNRVAVVTGASRGIGRAVALGLAEAGAKVLVNYNTSAEKADDVVKAITARDGTAFAFGADVSQPDNADRLIKAAIAEYERIDILVNNAGINRDNLLMRMSDDEWDETIRIDLKSAFLCTRAVLRPMMHNRWGRIINMSSVVGRAGNAGQANYSAAKAGLFGLTKSTAREMASRGITVNAIAPGFIDTEMTQRLGENVRDEALRQIPLGRFGTPDDVAALACFLASDAASYITGQILGVDGGMFMA